MVRIFIDDTGSPGVVSESLYDSTDAKTWVALILSEKHYTDARLEMTELLKELETTEASEFHFKDILQGTNEFRNMPLEERLEMLVYFAGFYRNFQFPLLVQTLASDDYLRNKIIIENHKLKRDNFRANNNGDLAHSHLFVKLVSLAFETQYPKKELEQIKVGLTKIRQNDLRKNLTSISDDQLLDDLIQMNMGEIRTLVHMHFLAPVIYAFTPKENKDVVAAILNGLAKDEVTHIGYTSKLIEEWCKDNNYKRASALYHQRLMDFHKLTISQTMDTIKQYGNNKYPMLLEI